MSLAIPVDRSDSPTCRGYLRAPHQVVAGREIEDGKGYVICESCLDQAGRDVRTQKPATDLRREMGVPPRSVAAIIDDELSILMAHRIHVACRMFDGNCPTCLEKLR